MELDRNHESAKHVTDMGLHYVETRQIPLMQTGDTLPKPLWDKLLLQ